MCDMRWGPAFSRFIVLVVLCFGFRENKNHACFFTKELFEKIMFTSVISSHSHKLTLLLHDR